jgi:hypothetical protein
VTTTAPFYKVLSADNRPAHGGARNFAWPLPTADGPGEWTPEIVVPIACMAGYHLTRRPMDWPVVGMRVYEAEGGGASSTDGDSTRDKTSFARARLLREAPEVVPAWWRAVESFVRDEIPAVPWFRPDGNPDPAWVLVERPAWGAAWDAAGDAAWDAAWGAAWDAAGGAAGDAAGDAARGAAGDAARDAALRAMVLVCSGLALAPEHVAHAETRWRVWQKGYALLRDVDGRLVVYAATRGGGS